jgi:hypothetical protein
MGSEASEHLSSTDAPLGAGAKHGPHGILAFAKTSSDSAGSIWDPRATTASRA